MPIEFQNNQNKLFGSVLRTKVLMLLALMGESFPAELARLSKAKLFSVQRIVDSLEREGIVVTRKLGLERRVCLNPRYYGAKELQALLEKRGDTDEAIQSALSARRSRPRRRGKAI